ncbi:MAG: hypothetical protein FWB80_00070 [Defluviitaleaceae bacterium]|nr:hypothetical protein [Defluviitaleaceae bacterium]
MDRIITEAEKNAIRRAKEEKLAEDRVKRANFREWQKLPYDRKISHAWKQAMVFYDTITQQYGANVHVSVGGLDSITLLMFLRKHVNHDIKGISVSSIEDKSINVVHKQLGIIDVMPSKSKVDVFREHGIPIISKDIAGKIEQLQNPTEKNATVRHAILTGETGRQGGYRKSSRMKLPDKWQKLFVEQEAPFKVSPKCCYYLKEKPCDSWAKKNNSFPYLGLMASEGGRRALALPINGCNYISKTTKRSCPFAIFNRQDLLTLALNLNVPIPEIYGTIERRTNGELYTTKAQRTGCSACCFGLHLDKRPHHFDYLREDNTKEWEFWMYKMGVGEALTYIGVGWE